MVAKEELESGRWHGFADAGFTTAEAFQPIENTAVRQEEYGWAEKVGIGLLGGTDPRTALPGAGSIIVLVDTYFRESFPRSLEGTFGRCYLDDDRVTRDGLTKRIQDFRAVLKENGIGSKLPPNLPYKAAACRAGLGTLGKNCLFYSRTVRGSSWVVIMPVVVDREFAPDGPTVGYGCPDWCRNACVAACPTRALGNGHWTRRCISYLTYFGQGVTPLELREPWHERVRLRPVPERLPAERAVLSSLAGKQKGRGKAEHFDLTRLLAMDADISSRTSGPTCSRLTCSGSGR